MKILDPRTGHIQVLPTPPPDDPRIEIWKDIAKEYRAINQELLALVRELISRLPPER